MKRLAGIAVAGAAALASSQALAQEAPAGGEYPSFWSRVTLEAPAVTHHFPHDSQFNDRNWGLLVDVALNDDWSVVGGGFRNSYRRNTAIAGVSWEPLKVDVSDMRLAFGAMAGLDLNRGYRGFNTAEPFLGAFNMRLSAADPQAAEAWKRFGLLLTVIPPAAKNGATAVNVAVTYRLR